MLFELWMRILLTGSFFDNFLKDMVKLVVTFIPYRKKIDVMCVSCSLRLSVTANDRITRIVGRSRLLQDIPDDGVHVNYSRYLPIRGHAARQV